jgi:hypothetical protein
MAAAQRLSGDEQRPLERWRPGARLRGSDHAKIALVPVFA